MRKNRNITPSLRQASRLPLRSGSFVDEVGFMHSPSLASVSVVHLVVGMIVLGVDLTQPIVGREFGPVEIVFFWARLPLLSSVGCLAKVFNLSVIRVFVVQDHRNGTFGGFRFGGDSVESSDTVVSVLLFFNGLLGVAHFRVADPRVVFVRPSFPFDEVVDDVIRLLSLSTADRAGFRVEDFFNLELLLIVDELRRRRGRYFLIREGRWNVRGQ